MYDNEEEIKRKRRNLLFVIGGVVLVILLLLVFIVLSSGKGNDDKKIDKELGCELEVQQGTLGANDTYVTEVVVGFKKIDKVSENYQTEATIGVSESPRNKKTYTISKSGTYTLHGYVSDEMGNKGTCSLDVVVSLSEPSCELEITKGTEGANGWYTTDVEVGFKTKSSNSDASTIVKYYMEEEAVSLDDNSDVERAEVRANTNSDTYVVTKNQITTVKGYVEDSNGVIGTCKITVKKDNEAPTCKLKVEKGTPDETGLYKEEPVIGIAEVIDGTSDVAAKGVGIEKNYENATYAVTAEGATIVYGYVIDNAGNEGVCSLEIKRPSSSAPTPTPTPTPTPDPTPSKVSYPTCSIELSGTSMSGKYVGEVTATMKYNTTNGATITQYGLGTSQGINGKNTYKENRAGQYTVYGMVEDNNGNVGYCNKTFTIAAGYLLYDKVNVGDYVDYNAGTWNETKSIPTEDETFGGYTSGSSRNNGVKCRSNDTGVKNGWVVMAKTNGNVILVHAGTPECFYHGRNVSASSSASKINQRAQAYINSDYAESASALNCSSSGVSCVKDKYLSGIHVTGTHYYLASAGSNGTVLWGVRFDGQMAEYSRIAYGIRPVIVLKSTTLTTGSKNANGAWILTKE